MAHLPPTGGRDRCSHLQNPKMSETTARGRPRTCNQNRCSPDVQPSYGGDSPDRGQSLSSRISAHLLRQPGPNGCKPGVNRQAASRGACRPVDPMPGTEPEGRATPLGRTDSPSSVRDRVRHHHLRLFAAFGPAQRTPRTRGSRLGAGTPEVPDDLVAAERTPCQDDTLIAPDAVVEVPPALIAGYLCN